ncbi:MAG: hypothetical protein AB7F91_01835 [Parvularculaceae bacterium]
MRSHLTAFGVGAGLSLLAAGVVALVAPRFADAVSDADGVHIVNIGNGDSGSFHLKDDGLNVSADWKGEFAIAADGRSLSSLRGKLEIVSVEKDAKRKASFEREGDGVRVRAFVGDKETSPETAAETEAADLLQLFARSSGVNAETRVKAMLADGGKKRVIDEIGVLKSAHAVGAYVESLASATMLTTEEISILVERLKGLESDYSKRTAISALLRAQTLDDASVEKVLDVAKTIKGDHELRLVIEDITDDELGARNLTIATRLIEQIEGDHEIRLALSSLLENERLSDADAARLLDLASVAIDGDYELRLAVEAAGEKLSWAAAGASAIKAISAIEGGHDRRLAIEEMGDRLDATSPHWLALIDAVAAVDSDYERRLAIEELASNAPDRVEVQAALKKAAEAIESAHERRLALDSLG